MANEKDVLNNEQNVEDYENKIKQVNKKIVAIRVGSSEITYLASS